MCITALVKALLENNTSNGFRATRIFPYNNQAMEKFWVLQRLIRRIVGMKALEIRQLFLTVKGLASSMHTNMATMKMI
jgi:hypothetical protein